jgi:ribonuclease P protein component
VRLSTGLPAACSSHLRYTLITIKKRKDFQATSGGLRFSAPAFTLLRRMDRRAEQAIPPQAIPLFTHAEGITGPLPYRFGFTVTKKLGNAVVRNRIRRRLKAAVVEAMHALPPSPPQEGAVYASAPYAPASYPSAAIDFVILARGAALTHPFDALCADFVRAITRLSGQMGRDGASEKPRGAANSPRMHAALGKSPAHRLEGNETE